LVAALLALSLLSACSADASEDEPTLRVLAAASLAKVAATVGEEFEAGHPGTRVEYSFNGSAELVAGVRNGSPGDVLVTADVATMDRVVRAGESLTEPVIVAVNRLALAVPDENPGHVQSLVDLARADLVVALCAPEVPCGSAAARVFAAVGIVPSVDTYESSVTGVLTKLMVGEVDAGLVYRTDLAVAGPSVSSVPLPDEADGVLNDYPAVVLRSAENRKLAKEFLAYLQSAEAQAELRRAGFELP
jgi:molybdate transport system substrate-binding protein